MIHYSKKDAWLVAVVTVAILLPLLISLSLFFETGGNWVAGATPLLALVILVLVLALSYPLYYEITPSGLTIRAGILVRQQIPLDSIREVFPTRNPLSAPAWSLDRLRVNYEGGYALISPKDKASFMEELINSDAGLEMKDGRVVRV
jgi:membrane protein YdbS with pleckstrin-like domain